MEIKGNWHSQPLLQFQMSRQIYLENSHFGLVNKQIAEEMSLKQETGTIHCACPSAQIAKFPPLLFISTCSTGTAHHSKSGGGGLNRARQSDLEKTSIVIEMKKKWLEDH